MTKRSKAFVAYAGADEDHAKIIFDAVRKANALPLEVKYEPWPFNDIAGKPLISPIIENIELAPFIVADITYLNLNVVYEIGYAIGQSKRVLLIKKHGLVGDTALAYKVGIFDTLGYTSFDCEEGVTDILSSHFDQSPLPISEALDKGAPVYLVEPREFREADVIIASRVKKAGFKYRSFSPGEDARMSATDAIRQVASSSGVVSRLLDGDDEEARIHNIRSLFVTGLADGMAKPTLLLSMDPSKAPLDVRDAVRPFRNERDLSERIAEFSPQVVKYFTELDPAPIDQASLLSSIEIGDPTAENEMTTLSRYYLRTDQFNRTIRGEVNLVVGRKGSGKTALFIQVRNKIRNDKRNVVVDLKPEGYQLIKLREEVFEYLTEGAREHLITAFWEYLILLEVAYKLLEKDKAIYVHNHNLSQLYTELRDVYLAGEFDSYGDFSERLLRLSNNVSQTYGAKFGKKTGQKLTAAQITELLHTYDIPKLREATSRYLENKESVWVLFDNLDKGWHTGGVDALDSVVVRCLTEAGRKIEREMREDGHKFSCIIFIRNDVYDNVMSINPDYGKEMRAVLDWTDPELLREMLRLRLVSGLGEEGRGLNFYQVWLKVCHSHYQGEESSQAMINRSLMRPRNLLKIFNHCRGFANNFHRDIIESKDIEKGLKAYSFDLFNESSRELGDVYHKASDVLYQFIDAPAYLADEDVLLRIMNSGLSEGEAKEVHWLLIYYGIFGIKIDESEFYIFDANYDMKVVEAKIRNSGGKAVYKINPAFWPALSVQETGDAPPHVGRLV